MTFSLILMCSHAWCGWWTMMDASCIIHVCILVCTFMSTGIIQLERSNSCWWWLTCHIDSFKIESRDINTLHWSICFDDGCAILADFEILSNNWPQWTKVVTNQYSKLFKNKITWNHYQSLLNTIINGFISLYSVDFQNNLQIK